MLYKKLKNTNDVNVQIIKICPYDLSCSQLTDGRYLSIWQTRPCVHSIKVTNLFIWILINKFPDVFFEATWEIVNYFQLLSYFPFYLSSTFIVSQNPSHSDSSHMKKATAYRHEREYISIFNIIQLKNLTYKSAAAVCITIGPAWIAMMCSTHVHWVIIAWTIRAACSKKKLKRISSNFVYSGKRNTYFASMHDWLILFRWEQQKVYVPTWNKKKIEW